MEQIMIVGAGSVGGFFGACLAKNNPNVSFLLRPRDLGMSVRQRGLTIRSAGDHSRCGLRLHRIPVKLAPPDLVILGVKAYDIDEVLTQLAPVLTIVPSF